MVRTMKRLCYSGSICRVSSHRTPTSGEREAAIVLIRWISKRITRRTLRRHRGAGTKLPSNCMEGNMSNEKARMKFQRERERYIANLI